MAVTFLLICIVFFISLNMGVIRIAPLDTLRVFSDRGMPGISSFYLNSDCRAWCCHCWSAPESQFQARFFKACLKMTWRSRAFSVLTPGRPLAVVLFIFFFQGSAADLSMAGTWLLPVSALAGAFLAALLIYVLAWKKGVSPVRLVLVGIGVNAGLMRCS